MMMHVSHQIICSFVLNLQRLSAEWRVKLPFVRNVKFVYLFSKSLEIRIITKESNLNVLNMGYKFDLVQAKQDVTWHLTYSRSVTNIAWKISLHVMKFVYFHKTCVLSVLIIGLNITYTKFWILWICPRPTYYLYTISTQNMTRAKWWNTCKAYQHLGTFIRPVRHEVMPSQERIFIWYAAACASP